MHQENSEPPPKVTCEPKDDIKSLGQFTIAEVLGENSQNKITFVHAKRCCNSGCEGSCNFAQHRSSAVIILEKKAIQKDLLPKYFQDDSDLDLIVQNDIYRNMDLSLPRDLNTLKATVIYPATEKHIEKYRDQEVFMITETADDYKLITLPFIQGTQFSLKWVYNILDHKSEMDRLIFEDPDPQTGFMLLPDLKWDGRALETLYCTAIINRRDLGCLRDLNRNHLPLLNNILKKGKKAIRDHYGVQESQLRIFIHYQPTYYHFHVHFTYLKYDAPGIYVGKAHLLSDVIETIGFSGTDGDYYQRATLHYTVRAGERLCSAFREVGKTND